MNNHRESAIRNVIGSLLMSAALALALVGNPVVAVVLAIIAHAYITKEQRP